MHFNIYDIFSNNMFQLAFQLYSGRCYYYKNTNIQMWLTVSPSLHNNYNYNFGLKLHK